MKRREEEGSGKCKKNARYLGSWMDVEGRTEVTVNKKIKAANDLLYSSFGFWKTKPPE